jgi:hypothetical protein
MLWAEPLLGTIVVLSSSQRRGVLPAWLDTGSSNPSSAVGVFAHPGVVSNSAWRV